MTKQAISQEELFVPLLWFIADHGGEIERQGDRLFEALAEGLALTEEELERKTEKGRDQWTSIVENCRRKLVARGLIETGTEAGIWRLTEEGLRQAEDPPPEMTDKFDRWLANRDTKPTGPRMVKLEEVEGGGSGGVSPAEQDAAEEVEDVEERPVVQPEVEVRESTKIQALLASIGAQMGFGVWLPKSDRRAVLQHAECPTLVDDLQVGFNETTLRTVREIDVLWLRGFSIIRAFEVEHTTAVYSGLLRMADLLALQPNLNIELHIVAPAERRKKVLGEIQRPVFTQLQTGPLKHACSFVSYEAVRDISADNHIAHLSDSVLDEYAEKVV
jgi:hypothetical protein